MRYDAVDRTFCDAINLSMETKQEVSMSANLNIDTDCCCKQQSLKAVADSNKYTSRVDLNDRFVVGKCSEYLCRYLKGGGKIESDCIDLVCWLFADQAFSFTHKAFALLGPVKSHSMDDIIHERFQERLAEVGNDHHEIASILADIIKTYNRPTERRFARILGRELGDVIKNNRSKDSSEIEGILAELKDMFSFTPKELEVVTFLFIMSTYERAESFFVNHLVLNRFRSRRHLLNILELSQAKFTSIFNGTIKNIGLLEMDSVDLRIERDFLELILSRSGKISNEFFCPLEPSTTVISQHFVDPDEVAHIINLLNSRTSSPTHILLYGEPGTGKTSFARGLAEELSFPAYQISQDKEGNESRARRAAIMACLNMTGCGQGALVVVDEADNLLNTQSSWFMRGETQDKGWLNNFLEKPKARIIWISNAIDNIDESVMRRFSYSVRFKPFGRRQRQILWENLVHKRKVKRFFNARDISSLASRYKLTAGSVDMALLKARDSKVKGRKDYLAALCRNLDSYETLQNKGKKKRLPARGDESFSLDGLHVNACLPEITEQLKQFDRYLRQGNTIADYSMNLLFYGPPGTGKSELARNLAFELDRELMIKGLSDILDPYVGMTERNIREAFEEAEAEEAVLVFDEVDSFLYSRSNAVRSWESSQTNEFLTCMERYRGVLICTTNMLAGLDKASLRRFNHKVGFDYLTPDGVVVFYEKFFGKLLKTAVKSEDEKRLRAIANLTPGDFKVIRDRNAFRPPQSINHKIIIKELAEEVRVKGLQGRAVIGF